jgi:hypothetical protein
MKQLHRPDMYGWSQFDTSRNIDFNSVLWVRNEGNVVVDPLPMSAHDYEHLRQLGGVRHIILTNSDHVRDTRALRERTKAKVFAPKAEQGQFPIAVDQWVSAGDEPVPGIFAYEMAGSKTPGELTLLVQTTTLITGDLIRSHAGGQLDGLPPSKLKDPARAIESIRKMSELVTIVAVLTGDGWPVFRDGARLLQELVTRFQHD